MPKNIFEHIGNN